MIGMIDFSTNLANTLIGLLKLVATGLMVWWVITGLQRKSVVAVAVSLAMSSVVVWTIWLGGLNLIGNETAEAGEALSGTKVASHFEFKEL